MRSVVGDPTIEFVFEEDQGNGRVVFGYRSRPNKYRIFHIFTRRRGGVQGGDVFVLKDGARRQITIEEFLEERRVRRRPRRPPRRSRASACRVRPSTARAGAPCPLPEACSSSQRARRSSG